MKAIRNARLLLLIGVLIVMALVVPASMAQTFGLSQSDYDLLNNAQTADSFAFQANFDLLIDTGDTNVSLTFAGNGTLDMTNASNPMLQISLNASMTESGSVTPISGELRVVDGIMYANIPGETNGWEGLALDEALGDLTGGLGTALPIDPNALASGDLGQLAPLMDAASAIDPTALIQMTRTGDASISGANTAHFIINFDIAGFFASPGFTQLMTALSQNAAALGDAGAALQGIPPGQLVAFGPMLGALFQNTRLNVEAYVGASDQMLYKLDSEMAMTLDPSVLGVQDTSVTLNYNLDFTMSELNQPHSVAAPEGATMQSSGGLNPVAVVPTVAPLTTGGGSSSVAGVSGGPITAGAPVMATFDGTGPVDLIYTAAGPETISVYAHSVDGTIDTTLEVLDLSGNRLDFNDDHRTTRPDLSAFDSALENLVLSAPGNYTLRVSSFSGVATGNVEVTVVGATGAAATNPDVPKAGTSSETVAGNLAANARYQYPVQFNQGEIVTITARDTSGTLDPKLAVLDSNLIVVAQNDDHGTNDASLDTFDSRVQNFIVPVSGQYTIEVTDFTGNAGTFDLTIERSAAGPVQRDVMTGELAANGRSQQRVQFNTGEIVTITVRDISNTLDPKVLLMDSNLITLAQNDDHGTNDASLDTFDSRIQAFTILNAGEYIIEISDFSGNAGTYELTIERR